MKQSLLYETYCGDTREIISYFKHTWIPDECFFPTVVNYIYEKKSQTGYLKKSLTYRLFNSYGRPQVFYSDKLDGLNISGYWFARKFDTPLVENIESTIKTISEQEEIATPIDNFPKNAKIERYSPTGNHKIINNNSSINHYYLLVEPEEINVELIHAAQKLLNKQVRFLGGLDTNRYNEFVKEMSIDLNIPVFNQWQFFKSLVPDQYAENTYKYLGKNMLFTIDLKSIHLKKYTFLHENPLSHFIFPRHRTDQKCLYAKEWLRSKDVIVHDL